MPKTHSEALVSRYQKTGGSYCIIIPPVAREYLLLAPRDLVVMRLTDDALVIRRFESERILSRQEARQIVKVAEANNGSEASNG